MVIHSYDGSVSDAERTLPIYAATIGPSNPQSTIHRPAGINDYQLLYTQSGVGAVIIKGEEFEVRHGDLFILPPFTPHEYRPISENWQTLWITYNGSVAKSAFPFPADIRQFEGFEPLYKKIKRGKVAKDWRRKTSSLLYELLLGVWECRGLAEHDDKTHEPDVSIAVQYIAEHYHETVELSKLAELSGLSEGHFCRVFKKHTHMRPVEYINNLRIERAKDLLLKKPPLQISEIAREVGYAGAAYFSKIFKEKTGVTPDGYRK